MVSPAIKNRKTAPFGYMIEMGQLIVHPAEGKIVRQMFAGYIAGASLKTIADDLTARKVEYLPSESAWNKSRVKRILEDARYLGNGQFPVLVDEASFRMVQAQKQDRNDRKVIQPESHIGLVTVPVVCAVCGSAMTRTHHQNRKITDAWDCPCGERVSLMDSDLLAGITEILNRLIAEPTLILEEPHQPDEARQLEVRRLQNEISRQLEGSGFDRDAVQQDIFALAAVKFTLLPSGPATAYRLRGLFEKSATLDSFSRELLEASVSQVLLGEDGVSLKLKNNQIVRKEVEHGSDSDIATHCDNDPGEA